MVFSLPQAWLQGSSTPTLPEGGGRSDDLTLQRTHASSFLLSSQVTASSNHVAPLLVGSWEDGRKNEWRQFVDRALCFLCRGGNGAEERRPAVGRRQQPRGLAQGRFFGEAKWRHRPARLRGGFEPERLRRRSQSRLSRQKGASEALIWFELFSSIIRIRSCFCHCKKSKQSEEVVSLGVYMN